MSDMQKKWRGGQYKKLLWWAAWSTYEEDFKDHLKEIGRMNVDAAISLLKYPPQTWCRAYFTTNCKNDTVDNNFSESFNSWIREARHKAIIDILEEN
ncbi:hypothetical protein Cni_G20358 [Canna indica]|uniref:Uncharacterized protein n=1 Tax=Canna indica TaxID=4628 RepID=A0AAQ3QHP7_9LILI|nr:hypothetical protein Cni_G20358 [Canna indica]